MAMWSDFGRSRIAPLPSFEKNLVFTVENRFFQFSTFFERISK